MPRNGPPPNGYGVTRHTPIHPWIDVPDVPFAGERPELLLNVPAETRAWWERITTMPHCVLWCGGDWQFAIDTARIHAAVASGQLRYAGELRIRERVIGTTLDARASLRVRYVPPEPVTEAPVMSAEDRARWRRLLEE